ncbi:MAG: hypothetical protein ABUT20_07565 [Bacteroidota bacterium]
MTNSTTFTWTPAQKIAFRFFFLFFSMTSLSCYNIFFDLFAVGNEEQGKVFSFLIKPITFLENHIFHLGYTPDMGSTPLYNSAFGWLLLFLILAIAITGTIAWTLSDKKRANYNKLHFWFRHYLAFYIFSTMILYAVYKIIPVQMPYPNASSLLTPVGDASKFSVAWFFIGVSPNYERFTGYCELIGSVLILFRRTRVFGSLFMTTILVNVVCLNIFYNIIVKLPSILLLLTVLFLLAPYIPKLISFFYYQKPVSLAEKQYRFSTPWKKYLFLALLLIPLWLTYREIKTALKRETEIADVLKEQKLYNVTTYISNKDTVPPSLNETIRWKRLLLSGNYRHSAIIYNMEDKRKSYDYKLDTIKQTLLLIEEGDSTKTYPFTYTAPAKDKIVLTGKWKSDSVLIEMDKFEINDFPLLNDEIRWVY